MSTEPSRQLGKYILQERLGHGGMAEVWKALDTQLQRHVAIKLLHANLQEDANFVTRFQHEAQAIASLRHPNIVQIHDFQVSQPPESPVPTPYMVMSYIEGQTLAEYIARTSAQGNVPSATEIVNLFTSISLAVDYAHQKGIIHRDIKPANILLDRHNTVRNPMGEPILTDFGLSKLLGVSAGALTATSSGTPIYTSPEQAQGYPGNERSDLYALGVILYEIMTGTPPFRGTDALSVLSQHIHVTPTSPSLLNRHVGPELALVMMTILSKDPNSRFRSASALTVALAQALHVAPPPVLKPSPSHNEMESMATYIMSPVSLAQGETGTALSFTSPTVGSSTPGMTGPGNTGQIPAPLVTPVITQSSQTPVSTGTVWAGGSLPGSVSSPGISPLPGTQVTPAFPVQPGHPVQPMQPIQPPPPVPPGGQKGRWRGIYTVLVILVIFALLGSGLTAFLIYRNNQPVVSTTPGGSAFFLSSGQFEIDTAQGIADQLQIELSNIPAPPSGKAYYAWLLVDRNPVVEKNPLQPDPQFARPLKIGPLPYKNGRISYFYDGTNQQDNLFSTFSRILVTEESIQGTQLGPAADRSTWRYYAEVPQTPFGASTPQLSALDHIRHLFYKETKAAALGLPGGLDVWLFRNTEKILEWSTAAQGDYNAQGSNSAQMRDLFLALLDELDGVPNVHLDVPDRYPTDNVRARVALLSVDPIQSDKKDLPNNPPGYLDHVQLHLNQVVQAPDSNSQMRALASKIVAALNKAKLRLQQVRKDAQQLVKMNAAQLAQPAALNLLNDMLVNATYAYIGRLDPVANQVEAGILQVHYDIQKLATLTLTTNLPEHI